MSTDLLKTFRGFK